MKALKKISILLILLFAFINIYSQSVTFKKVYPDIAAIDPNKFRIDCIAFNNDNSFLVIPGCMKLLKINKTGEITFSKGYLNFGSIINSVFNNKATLTFYSDAGNYKKLLKLDTSFNLISVKQYDSLNWWQSIDRHIICKTVNQDLILSGGRDVLVPVIFKTDSLGNVLWGKYFTPIKGGIQDIVQTPDSGFAIAVNLVNAGASLIKTDKNGNVLWAKSYFRPRGFVHSLVENTDGTLLMTGSVDSINTWPNYELYTSPLFITKIDKNGNVIWAKKYNEPINGLRTWPSQIKCTQDSGYIILATVALPNQTDDILLIKIDANGDTLWVRAHGSPNSFECGHSIEQLNDKGYIIVGGSNNNIPVPLSSLYLVRTDSLGHTDSLCEEYSLTLAVNNITVNDSNITVTSVPFTVHTSIAGTSTQSFITYAYDGCKLDDIQEIYTEQTTPLLIYPNPTDGLFAIETKMNTPIKTDIEIYNVNSERVYYCTTNKSLTNINLSGMAKGLYFIRMGNEKWVKSGKVMVE